MSKRRSRRGKHKRPKPNRNLRSASNVPVANAPAANIAVANVEVCDVDVAAVGADDTYRRAAGLAERGDFAQARTAYSALVSENVPPRLLALAANDIGALDAMTGELAAARTQFERALAIDAECDAARLNLAILDAELCAAADTSAISLDRADCDAGVSTADAQARRLHHNVEAPSISALASEPERPGRVRVAIVSMLFNWPSTGGGTVHTAETGKFLSRAGFDVQHLYAQYAGWGVGNVTLPLEHAAVPIAFEPADWNAAEIQRRFREAVDQFTPDYVIITDSWNFKPVLAEAMSGYKYFLRLAAQECLCPLNNVRLLVDDRGQFSACPRNQLATPDVCRQCVSQRQHQSGSLHQAERALSDYGNPAYDGKLRQAFADAEGVLAVNPLIAATVRPFSKAVHVVPSGFDPDRFPASWPDEPQTVPKTKATIFFAGIVQEYMKGFQVLHAACAKLWQTRQDFELVATCDPPGQVDPMTRFIGWLSQDDLPRHLREAAFLVFPTIAEEALGRSAVEAMGVGRPVIASRIGGLSFTVVDELTGLLFEPGNVDDLAAKIETLLDDPALRDRMGAAGRQRFVERFTWDSIIDRHYRVILKPRQLVDAPVAESIPSPLVTHMDPSPDFLHEVASCFGIRIPEAERMLERFREMREVQRQANGSGSTTKLILEQEFLLSLLMSLTRPATVIVVGDQAEGAVRQFQELKAMVGAEFQVLRYDGAQLASAESNGKALDFGHDIPDPSALAEQADVGQRNQQLNVLIGSFDTDILHRFGSGLIWLASADATLVERILTETSRHFGQWLLAIQSDPTYGGSSSVPARLSDLADRVGFAGSSTDKSNGTHRFRTFESAAGMTLVIPSHLCASQSVNGNPAESRDPLQEGQFAANACSEVITCSAT